MLFSNLNTNNEYLMRQLLLILFPILVLPCFGIAQNDSIQILRTELKTVKEGAFISKSFKLAKLYIQQKDYSKGVDQLEKAIIEAKRMGLKNVQASVNTGVATSILRDIPPNKNYQNRAFNSIETSINTGGSLNSMIRI